jgi:hypothetical protein
MANQNASAGVVLGGTPWPVLVLAGAALLLLAASLALFAKTEWFLHSAVLTNGVLERISSPDGRTGTIFKFSTLDGQMVRHESSVTVRSTGMPGPGDRVPVYYDPANPSHAQIGLWAWLWLAPTVLGGLGTVFGIVLIGLRTLSGRG